MTTLTWDQVGERLYETGVDHAVLYIPDSGGAYADGYAWNGITAITESPSGAEPTPVYADNIKYLNLVSVEEFGATVEAFTYPDEFGQCDGTSEPETGVLIGQQNRKTFGLSYRTLIGNDVDQTSYGYKLHLIYGALAAPSEKARSTVNETPEATPFSWAITTTAVELVGFKPTAELTIDSTKVDSSSLNDLEDLLYGTVGTNASLPLPSTVVALFSGTVIEVFPTAPTYDVATDTITIPSIVGVIYKISGEVVTGAVVITEDTVVTAVADSGYKFPAVSDSDWYFEFT